jgi:methylmalonyl-CoA mutase C-terminal domain/subunit
MEVIYTGTRQTPEMIVKTALQEDVDIIGLSILSGAHNELCSRVFSLLREGGHASVPIILGGIIPEDDIPMLKKMGVKEVFGPGTLTQRVVDYVRNLAGTRENRL